MREELFVKTCKGMNSVDILNYYRNLYYTESVDTEKGILAWAINDILPKYVKLNAKMKK